MAGVGRFLLAVPTEKRELFREPVASGPLPTDDVLSAFTTAAKSNMTNTDLFTKTLRIALSSLTLSRILSLNASGDFAWNTFRILN